MRVVATNALAQEDPLVSPTLSGAPVPAGLSAKWTRTVPDNLPARTAPASTLAQRCPAVKTQFVSQRITQHGAGIRSSYLTTQIYKFFYSLCFGFLYLCVILNDFSSINN